MGAEDTDSEKDKKSGCNVGIVPGFIMLLLAIAIAVGVGIVVYFATVNGRPPCLCTDDGAEDSKGNGGKMPVMGSNTTENIMICKELLEENEVCITLPASCSDDTDETEGSDRDIRLPSHLTPMHYDIEIKPDIYGDDPEMFEFTGKVSIEMSCSSPTNEVILHARDITIDVGSIRITTGSSSGAPAILSTEIIASHDFFIIHLGGYLSADKSYTVSMDYKGPLSKDLKGMYLTSFAKGTETSWGIATQLEPIDAREMFPGFDEPNIKATFSLTVLHKASKKAFSNMPMLSQETRNDGWIADVYDRSVKMSTYLVAVVIGDYEITQNTTRTGKQVRLIGRAELIPQMPLALEMSMYFLSFYEDYFGIELPIPKLDIAGVGDFVFTAMENWGLIIIREEYLLSPPEGNTATSLRWMAVILAHEISHMWFGNLVTMDWWDDLWLNEGFASYISYLSIDDKYPEWKMFDTFVIEETQYVMPTDSLVSSHPVFQPIGHPDEIGVIFDVIAYSKGAAVIRMMKNFLGEETFKLGLKRYLTDFSYKNTQHTDLWDSLAQQAKEDGMDIDVTTIMNTWIKQLGYPVVTMSRDPDAMETVHVTQNHYLLDPTQPPRESPYGYNWKIPFTFATDKTADWSSITEVWMDMNNITVTVPASTSWFIGNIDVTGYYRVNYSPENWANIVEQLNEDLTVFPISNRAQLIDDAFELGSAGLISLESAVELTKYLAKETEFHPWKAASKRLEQLRNKFRDSEYFGYANKYISNLVSPLYDCMGWDTKDNTKLTDNLLRQVTVELACSTGTKACVDKAKEEFTKFKADPVNYKIDPNARSQVFINGITHGTLEDWEWMLEYYFVADPTHVTDLIKALCSTSEPWLITRMLSMVLDGTIINQYLPHTFIDCASTSVGSKVTWDFIRERWDLYVAAEGPAVMRFGDIMESVLGNRNTQFDLDAAKAFRDVHADEAFVKKALTIAIETIRINMEWKKKNEAFIGEWFKQATMDESTSLPASCSTDTEETEGSDRDIRLPSHLTPIHYDIEIKPDIYGDDPEMFEFTGKVSIEMSCSSPTDEVILHARDITIDVGSIVMTTGENGVVPGILSTEIVESRDFFIIHLRGKLSADTDYTVSMDYKGPLSKDLKGMYLTSFAKGNETSWGLVTQLEPVDGREMFPGFDEPNLKATFSLTVLHKASKRAFSNMPMVSQETRDDGWIADVFDKSVKMSTYLVALAIGDYGDTKRTTTNGKEVRLIGQSELIPQMELALEMSVEFLDFYEDYFGIELPIPKLDIAGVPDFGMGAMENWGLIVIREEYLLSPPEGLTASNLRWMAIIIAHEISHMWFGNLVTMDWWDDLWLNEGFASYISYLSIDAKYPEWKMFDTFVISETQFVMSIDSLVSSHPVFQPIANPDEIFVIFDDIAYSKGAAVIRMMQTFLGEETFKMGLKRYLTDFSYKNTKHTDLWNSLGQQALEDGMDIDVTAVMNTWILQLGFPLVTMMRDADSPATVHVTQNHFLLDTSQPPRESPYDYKWMIPFTYATADTSDWSSITETWMDMNNVSVTIPTSTEWFIGNIEERGYYRVNYSPENWAKLAAQLNEDLEVFPISNRAQLLDDAFELGSAGISSLESALEMTKYLAKETEFHPWTAAAGKLDQFITKLRESKYYGYASKYLSNLVSPVYDRIGWDTVDNTKLNDNLLRQIIVGMACASDTKACVDKAKEEFVNFKADPKNYVLDPNARSRAYITGITHGTLEDWEWMLEYYFVADPTHVTNVLRALCATSQPWLIRRMLSMVLDGTIINQFLPHTFIYCGSTTVGSKVTWDFIRENFDEYLAVEGPAIMSFEQIVGTILASRNSQLDMETAAAFLDAHSDKAFVRKAMDIAMETIKINIEWKKKNEVMVGEWFKQATMEVPDSEM